MLIIHEGPCTENGRMGIFGAVKTLGHLTSSKEGSILCAFHYIDVSTRPTAL